MNREEMLEKMSDVSSAGRSQLHMRSEKIQQRNQVKRIPMLKKALRKKSKLLIITDLALPFNPETGVEDEVFNTDNKFRPPYSATTVALMLKLKADTNESLKNALMRRAGVKEWDTSDAEKFTKEDWTIFTKYRVPRIFTVPVVHVNIPVMTNNEFGRDYAISVEYDEATGDIVGDIPGVLKVNKLFRDKIYEELQEYQKGIDAGEIHDTEKQQKQFRRDVYGKNPVSDVQPSNWITAIELPLLNNYTLSGDLDFASFTADTAKSALIISRLSKSISDALGKYRDGSWERYDKNFDYFEIDMCCPTEGDDNSQQGRMTIGKDTQFEKPGYSLCELLDDEVLNTTQEALTKYLDSCEDIEEMVRRSIYTPPYSDEVENQIYTSLSSVLDIENDKYLTQRVLDANREVISIAFGGVGSELLDALDAGVSDAAEGALEEDASAASAKAYSLDSPEFQDDQGDLDVELAEVDLAE